MKTSTSRAYRAAHLSHYRLDAFESFDDYFLYLHLNSQVQRLHVFGAVTGVCLLPWALWALVLQHELVPSLLYLTLFYGTGLISHRLVDGRFADSGRSFMQAFESVLRFVWRWLRGEMPRREAAFAARYPHTLWVYLQDAPRPEGIPADGAPVRDDSLWQASPGFDSMDASV